MFTKSCNNCAVKKCKGLQNIKDICILYKADSGLMQRPFNCYKLHTLRRVLK